MPGNEMPGNDQHDPLDNWLNQQVRPLPPPPGTFELITRRARRRKLRKLAVTVASAAAVAAAVAVAVPNVIALNVTPSHETGNPVAAGHDAFANRRYAERERVGVPVSHTDDAQRVAAQSSRPARSRPTSSRHP